MEENKMKKIFGFIGGLLFTIAFVWAMCECAGILPGILF